MALLTDYWWVLLILAVFVGLFFYMRRKNNKQTSKEKICKHVWQYGGAIILNQGGKDYPRQVQYCKKCQSAIHLPIKTYQKFILENK